MLPLHFFPQLVYSLFFFFISASLVHFRFLFSFSISLISIVFFPSFSFSFSSPSHRSSPPLPWSQNSLPRSLLPFPSSHTLPSPPPSDTHTHTHTLKPCLSFPNIDKDSVFRFLPSEFCIFFFHSLFLSSLVAWVTLVFPMQWQVIEQKVKEEEEEEEARAYIINQCHVFIRNY